VGFLSDYSRLEVVSDTTLRHIDQNRARGYSKFIVDPVVVHFHGKSKATEIEQEELDKLRQYMYWAIRNRLYGHYVLVNQSGPGIARIRVALTDLKKSNPVLNTLPQTKLMGTGLGGASMEAELIDSVTGRQIAAIVETQKGKKLSMAGMTKWGDAQAVMDRWAQRFRERLDEVHKR
jgi:hypothetical protein